MDYMLSPYVQFHLALKYLVKEKWHRKQKFLAKKINLSEGHLSDIIKNKTKASFDTQVALAQACGLSYENMLALGRKIHLKEDILKIVLPDTGSPADSKEKRDGNNKKWQPVILSADWGLVLKTLEIIHSNTKHRNTLIHIIDILYAALKKRGG